MLDLIASSALQRSSDDRVTAVGSACALTRARLLRRVVAVFTT
ncbi:hypothetical protein [Mycolicibacterium peregrinum]|nr:hypothetical protein [Mycolicibacterium peregrinum]